MTWYWYQENPKNEAVLLRAFGDLPEISVPVRINGMPVTSIGDYCFSEKEKISCEKDQIQIYSDCSAETGNAFYKVLNTSYPEQISSPHSSARTAEEFHKLYQKQKICPLAGSYLKNIVLPDTVRQIGSLAFYQCSQLEEICFGENIQSIGSDTFMNCHSLKSLVFSSRPEHTAGLRQLLMQLNREITVSWQPKKHYMSENPAPSDISDQTRQISDFSYKTDKSAETDAAVFFPEYREGYDLIGPAHIFELNIEGEGFRARQCFADGIFQFGQYDRIFEQACHTEEEPVLCKMASLRLSFPYHLEPETRERYLTYLLAHMDLFCAQSIHGKDLWLIQKLLEQEILSGHHLDLCIQTATREKWAEGIRTLLEWKKNLQKDREEEEYGFEDF